MLEKIIPKTMRNEVSMGRIYIKVYMTIIRQNFSHSSKVFLSETFMLDNPKNQPSKTIRTKPSAQKHLKSL